MMNKVLSLALFLSVLAISCQAGLKIYYVRHGETGANVAAQWKKVEPEKRPAYVGKVTQFTPEGEKQVRELVGKLEQHQFDFIACSPAWRTCATIKPYLEAKGRKAEIWPELASAALRPDDRRAVTDPYLPPPRANLFDGEPIELAQEHKPFFTMRADAPRQLTLDENGRRSVADIAAMDRAKGWTSLCSMETCSTPVRKAADISGTHC